MKLGIKLSIVPEDQYTDRNELKNVRSIIITITIKEGWQKKLIFNPYYILYGEKKNSFEEKLLVAPRNQSLAIYHKIYHYVSNAGFQPLKCLKNTFILKKQVYENILKILEIYLIKILIFFSSQDNTFHHFYPRYLCYKIDIQCDLHISLMVFVPKDRF